MQLVYDTKTGEPRAKIIYAPESYGLLCNIASKSHPNLMYIYSVTLYQDRCECICEYINGVSLEQMISHEGPCSEKEAKRIMIQICDGLKSLHSRGIIHRDIKPSNVMIDARGRVKIVDFDISRTYKNFQSKDTQILGSVGYTSLEQFGFMQTDEKADVYSCGVLLNFLLTGFRPDEKMYEGKMQKVIETCIQIDRDKRFENVVKLQKAIRFGHFSGVARFFPLPGFRGNNAFFKFIVALLLIAYVIFAAISFDAWIIDGSVYAASNVGIRNWFGLNIFMILLPYLFFGNFAYLSDLICPKYPRAGRALLVFLGIASIFFGFYLVLQGL